MLHAFIDFISLVFNINCFPDMMANEVQMEQNIDLHQVHDLNQKNDKQKKLSDG